MKLHFEPDLDYQKQAIESVCDLFRGQEVCRTEFTVTMRLPEQQLTLGVAETDLGVGNRLTLLDDQLLKNLQDVQMRNGLAPAGTLASGDFTVEMETGTGKTYVYLRTIFELNKRYGFTKFVIVVPSVAIKEGVYKSLQITEEHFKALYAGVPVDFFLYDSAKLGQVRNFATSSAIQVMVVTVGAINKKDVNNLYKDSEKTGGEKPIDLIRATHPIVIVDEPQTVSGDLSGAGKAALDAMNPLCTVGYSATPVDKRHMVFRLDAVDAYERKLVKQIEVAAATVEDAFNKPYVRLVGVTNKRGRISAQLELHVQEAAGPKLREVSVGDGDDLQQVTKRAIYADFRIGEINTAKGSEFVELRYPGGEVAMAIGQAHGGVDELAVQREMIRRTIREHLEKEKLLRPKGIKVLSLFFIESVDRYRRYDSPGNSKGDFRRNPQQFIEQTAEQINRCKRLALVDGIKYQKLGDQQVYAQELFEQQELTGYLKSMLQDTVKSIHEHVVYDSTTERDFAQALEFNQDVMLYAKLPNWFKVPTPLGNYNPDWAVLLQKDGVQRLYFVVETKSSLFADDLRDKEWAKIECGRAHFAALATGENPARYLVARSFDDVLQTVN